MSKHSLLVLALCSLLAAAPEDPVVRPEARVQTDPVAHAGDAADDPAIWIHPTDPAKSLILGTDKQSLLLSYDLHGKLKQQVSRGTLPNNVDVLYGMSLGGKTVDLAVASVRNLLDKGFRVWLIDPDKLELTDITPRNKAIRTFGGHTPYGICAYRSWKSGKSCVFVSNKEGQVEQFLLEDDHGSLRATSVRRLQIGGVIEGLVADDELGWLYVGQEDKGVWKFSAEPEGGQQGKLIHRVGEHGLKNDVEGLAIYYAAGGKGYLIVSSQGNNTFKVYRREGDNEFVLTVDPKEGKIDDVNDTDGIAVTNRATSRQFAKGMFIAQDGSNKTGKQNFKIYAWEDIAGDKLLIDTEFGPRQPAQK